MNAEDGRDQVAASVAAWAAAREAAGEGGPVGDPPRSVVEGAVVELREVTGDSVRAICRLLVAPAQRGFVAPNAVSFAEALFTPTAWYRAVYADGTPVGFVMLNDEPGEPAAWFLWRFMIDARHQGRGYGRRALELVIEEARSRPVVTSIVTSWVPGPGTPEPFYLGLGFERTGEIDGDEVVGRLRLGTVAT